MEKGLKKHPFHIAKPVLFNYQNTAKKELPLYKIGLLDTHPQFTLFHFIRVDNDLLTPLDLKDRGFER